MADPPMQASDPATFGSDQQWDADQRGETELERLDRNWSDLLQELRVVQTGVQLLTGFLLTLPFQARFSQLDESQQNIYLVALMLAIAATGLLVAPVVVHRMLFRRHARLALVTVTHRLALIGTVLLGAAMVAVVVLLFDVLHGGRAAAVAAGATLLFLLMVWVALPQALRGSGPPVSSQRRLGR